MVHHGVGIGIRVEARAFQWNNPLVRDALFWEYNITNISDYDLNEMAFGYWWIMLLEETQMMMSWVILILT